VYIINIWLAVLIMLSKNDVQRRQLNRNKGFTYAMTIWSKLGKKICSNYSLPKKTKKNSTAKLKPNCAARFRNRWKSSWQKLRKLRTKQDPNKVKHIKFKYSRKPLQRDTNTTKYNPWFVLTKGYFFHGVCLIAAQPEVKNASTNTR